MPTDKIAQLESTGWSVQKRLSRFIVINLVDSYMSIIQQILSANYPIMHLVAGKVLGVFHCL